MGGLDGTGRGSGSGSLRSRVQSGCKQRACAAAVVGVNSDFPIGFAVLDGPRHVGPVLRQVAPSLQSQVQRRAQPSLLQRQPHRRIRQSLLRPPQQASQPRPSAGVALQMGSRNSHLDEAAHPFAQRTFWQKEPHRLPSLVGGVGRAGLEKGKPGLEGGRWVGRGGLRQWEPPWPIARLGSLADFQAHRAKRLPVDLSAAAGTRLLWQAATG